MSAGTLPSDMDLKHAVIEFYREELRDRYQLDNVRRFSHFDPIPDAQVDTLREYFLEYIYPPPKIRDTIDDAFDHLGEVLRSPRRLRPLMGTAIGSMFKFGTRLPAAISAGVSTLDAYMETRKLEKLLLQAARELGITKQDQGNRDRMICIMANVPEEDVRKLIHDVMQLFRALSNTKMLVTAVEFLGKCAELMKKRPELYTEHEVEGITLGRAVVKGGLDLFEDLGDEDLRNMVVGIEQIEMDWYAWVSEQA